MFQDGETSREYRYRGDLEPCQGACGGMVEADDIRSGHGWIDDLLFCGACLAKIKAEDASFPLEAA